MRSIHRQSERNREHGWTLVEVLVAGTITVIVTGMLIMVWISLTGSWTVTARGTEARESARDATARMSREIRDMEPKVGQFTAITGANRFKIDFYTTFNLAGNQNASTAPVLTQYEYVASDGTLHRRRDTNTNDEIDGDDRDMVVATNLLNTDDQPMFVYTYVDDEGARQTDSDPTSLENVLVIDVRIVVDMQPGTAPKPMELTTTVQLRNTQ